ncbi:MAG: polyribonucleotide nucleotidyltransferase [Clostridia bacterium]|nr:polyribonucleotide nucleotidyltransferase [Clostridia bacterium]
MTNVLRKSIEIAGRTLTLETGRMAKQASGAVFVKYGKTNVLATATASLEPRDGIDFFPLTVDYEEKMYAVGKIPGGFIKREGRATEKAILSSRLIDRPVRPLFPKAYRNDVQIVTTVLSVDQDNPPEITAMVGASAALHISHIPFGGPIAGVVVGMVDGEFVINPTVAQKEKSTMHMVVAGTADAIMMVEAGAQEVPEATILDGIMFAFEEIKRIVAFIEEFRAEALALGLAKEKLVFEANTLNAETEKAVRDFGFQKLNDAIHHCAVNKLDKKTREALLDNLKAEIAEAFSGEEYAEEWAVIHKAIDSMEKEAFRIMIARDKLRIDGRSITEVRPITCEIDVLDCVHGSALFTRGQTQVLNVLTLGTISDEQHLDGLGLETGKRYMHHYNFPPFSVGETRPMRGPGRREIGHGALAERALEPVIPSVDDFPYTLRLVSEAIESNGSTSMASVCGSTLSLMAAGVPISAPVSGVAMGLITDGENMTILTDIQGMEDFLGDMDFKVAGTEKGVTAIQMDIKIAGINKDILTEALAQAREGRMFIMGKILEAINAPRAELSEYAPRIIRTTVHPDKIREVIGSGGKVIKKIIEETGAQIDIEDDGSIFISSVDAKKGEAALEIIESIVEEPEMGKIYEGKVVKIMDFGAFVEIIPGVFGMSGKEGMVHISQLDFKRVEKVTDVCQEGDTMRVKVIGIDNQSGKIKLSRKDALER